MIITEKVLLKMNNKWIRHFWNKGYICKQYDIIEAKVEDLTKNSHAIIEAKCDVCGKIVSIKYQWYNTSMDNDGYYACSKKCGHGKYVKGCLEKYGVTNTAKLDSVKNKMEKTCIERYGCKAPAQNVEVMKKNRNTCLERYGVEYTSSIEIIKDKWLNTKMKKGIIISNNEKTEFDTYKIKVRRITRNNKKELYNNWNGYDYYDNEYIKENLKLGYNNKLYPTIDHKISVFQGYKNSIPPEKIGDIENLCVTKRTINSSKGNKII